MNFEDFWGFIADGIEVFINAIASFFPVSNVQTTFDLAPYRLALQWANWFIPFDFVITMLTYLLGMYAICIVVRAIAKYFGIL